MTEGSGPCGEDFYSGFLRGFPQFPVERGERRSVPDGEFQISGIVNRELMLGGDSDHGIPGGRSMRWLDADRQRRQIASKSGDPFEIEPASAHGHEEAIHNFGRPVGGHDGKFARAKTLKESLGRWRGFLFKAPRERRRRIGNETGHQCLRPA